MSERVQPKILVVDPDASIRALLVAILKRKGIEAESTEDPDEALELAADDHYEAFIVEPRMAGGDALLGRLRDGCGCPSKIIVATTPDAWSAGLAVRPGVAAVLFKPFLLDDLHAVLESWACD